MQRKIYLQLKLRSHVENENGWCSDDDIEIKNDAIETICQVKYIADENIKNILLDIGIPFEVAIIIQLYNLSLTRYQKKKRIYEHIPFGHWRGCRLGSSYTKVKDLKIINSETALEIINREPIKLPEHITLDNNITRKHYIISHCVKEDTSSEDEASS